MNIKNKEINIFKINKNNKKILKKEIRNLNTGNEKRSTKTEQVREKLNENFEVMEEEIIIGKKIAISGQLFEYYRDCRAG